MPLFLSIILFFVQDTVPYKPAEEFEIKLDYQFKMRPAPNQYEFAFDESSDDYKRRVSKTPLPYLILELEVLKVSPEEERLQGSNGVAQVLNKRGIKPGTQVKIDMGFTTDMKDRVSPHEYTLIFSDKKKKEISKIVIFIDEDGSFLVNGVKRGQF